MVLYFLYAILGVLAFIAAGLFCHSLVTLRAELTGGLLYIKADVRVIFRIVRIKASAWLRMNDAKESIQADIAGIRIYQKKKNKKKKKKKRQKKLDLGRLIPKGSMKSASLRGRVQLFDDACANTLLAGALNAAFGLALFAWFECKNVKTGVAPSFGENELWLNMEGIFDITGTQIIEAIIKYRKEGRTSKNGTSDRKHNEGDDGKPGFNG